MMVLLCFRSLLLILCAPLLELSCSVYAANDEKPLQSKSSIENAKSYAPGDRIVVECLNRTT